MPSSVESECDSTASSSSSELDDDQLNARVYPCWLLYRDCILSKGYRLDTVHDVREHYRQRGVDTPHVSAHLPPRTTSDDSALCKDPGLPENLFRATSCMTGVELMIKVVNRQSREAQIVRLMSSPHFQRDPMNHCIPVLDIIDVPTDDISFIVMEAWSSHLLPEIPPTLRDLLSAIHQCIEHVAFMHRNRIAHLDISLHNFLTDYHGRCACIDYEHSWRVDGVTSPGIYSNLPKGTEVPPELERGQACNPFMIDVWALAILILRACKIADICVPELVDLTGPMLHHNPDRRPSVAVVLQEFRRLLLLLGEERLDQPC